MSSTVLRREPESGSCRGQAGEQNPCDSLLGTCRMSPQPRAQWPRSQHSLSSLHRGPCLSPRPRVLRSCSVHLVSWGEEGWRREGCSERRCGSHLCPLPPAREQLALLEARKLQYQRAALQAKRGRDLEQAKAHLRVAKSLEAQITQVRAGRPVDLSKVSVAWLSSRTCRAERWVAVLMSRTVNKVAWRRGDLNRMW